MEFSKQSFKNEVQNYPTLYDKFDREFKDIHKRRNVWDKDGNSFPEFAAIHLKLKTAK